MADTFSNDLRLRLQESGSNAGTWGDLLNGTITNIASALGQGSEVIPNASTHTITLADGTADEARSLYLKCTGGGQACTVTLGPNTISKVWIIDNETAHTLTFKQGNNSSQLGTEVAIGAGAVKMIVTNGAGVNSSVTDALFGLEGALSTLAVTGEITANGGIALGDNDKATFGASDDLQIYHDGSHSYVSDTGTGYLRLKGSNYVQIFDASDAVMANFESGGGVYLSHNGADRFSTTSTGIAVTGSVTASPSGGVVTLGTSGHITSKQSLDVATAGGRFIGSSNRGVLGQIRIEQTANSTDGGYIAFDTAPSGSTSPQERMRIDGATGSVGIGCTPTQELEIKAASVPTLKLNQAGTYGAEIALRGNDLDIKGSANAVVFYTGGNNDVSTTERMKLSAAGHLILSTDAGYFQVTGPSSSAWAFGSTGGNNVPGSSSTGMGWHRWNGSSWLSNMYLGPSGVLGVFGSGTTSPRGDTVFTSGTSISSKRWGFGGGATGNNAVFYVINEGNVGVYLPHGNQAWIAHSDERIKENITDVGTVLPSLMNIRCVKYNLISNPDDTKIGFIAQDWESSFPEIVDENEHLVLEDDGTIGTDDDSDSTTPVKAMAYTETIPLLLKAIQEQQATIESQAAAINDLTTRLTALENN